MKKGDLENTNTLLPGKTTRFFIEIAEVTRFSGKLLREIIHPPFEHSELLRQCFKIGFQSLPLISLTGLILGLVITMQSRPVLVEFGAEIWLPGMVAVSIVREIGPVITSLICAGKIGSSMGAELGSMRVTEQIDAMEVSGTNPMKYLVATRVLAATFMVPLLVIYADAIALYGSYAGARVHSHVTFSWYLTQAFDWLHYSDVIPAFIKTFFFGFAIGLIGCFKGYSAKYGTEEVGKAANSAVVAASVMVFVLDLIAVQLTDIITNI